MSFFGESPSGSSSPRPFRWTPIEFPFERPPPSTGCELGWSVKGHIELPSDLQGIIHFGYNKHIKEVVNKLCKRLRECGFDLDPDMISEASA